MVDINQLRGTLRAIARAMPAGLPPLETAGLLVLAIVWLFGG